MSIELDLTGLPVELVALIRQTHPQVQKATLAGLRAKELWPNQLVLVGLVRVYLLQGPKQADRDELADDVLAIWRSYSEQKQEGV